MKRTDSSVRRSDAARGRSCSGTAPAHRGSERRARSHVDASKAQASDDRSPSPSARSVAASVDGDVSPVSAARSGAGETHWPQLRAAFEMGRIQELAIESPINSPSKESPKIKVTVRCRPFIQEEYDRFVEMGISEPMLCVKMPSKHHVDVTREDGSTERFDFDRCYWSHDEQDPHYADQETIFRELGEKMLVHSINGFNNCIFAYGQTGSGKSYSVIGANEGPGMGLLPRIVQGLFRHFENMSDDSTCHCLVSFVEIYNEQILDLLAPQGERPRLEVRSDPVLGTVILGLTEPPVETSEKVFELIQYGQTLRSVGETAMNKHSSRSHAIFTVKTSVLNISSGQKRFAHTHIVDLAGSERAKRTEAAGERLKEGAIINRSLMTLARVISSLAAKKKSQKDKPPFRDSKLTHILKESLCGNSKTAMMAAISPSLVDVTETFSTLRFAQSVKEIKTHAVPNEANEKGIEQQLRAEIEKLQQRLRETEQLYKGYAGSEWEALLAKERRRNEHRKAVLNLDLGPEELAILGRQWEERFNSPGHHHTLTDDGSEVWSGRSSDCSSPSEVYSDDLSAGQSTELQGRRIAKRCLLVNFAVQNGHSSAAREESRSGDCVLAQGDEDHGSLVLTGTAAEQWMEEGHDAAATRSDNLHESLRALARQAVEAERICRRLSSDDTPRVYLKAVFAVNPGSPRHTEPIVIVARRSSAVLTAAEVWPRDAEEIVSMAQMRQRLERLRSMEQKCTGRDAWGDAWTFARRAQASVEDDSDSSSREAKMSARQLREFVRRESQQGKLPPGSGVAGEFAAVEGKVAIKTQVQEIANKFLASLKALDEAEAMLLGETGRTGPRAFSPLRKSKRCQHRFAT